MVDDSRGSHHKSTMNIHLNSHSLLTWLHVCWHITNIIITYFEKENKNLSTVLCYLIQFILKITNPLLIVFRRMCVRWSCATLQLLPGVIQGGFSAFLQASLHRKFTLKFPVHRATLVKHCVFCMFTYNVYVTLFNLY